MNKEYVYKDGKAIIIDDKGVQKTVDYYDNLYKVLVQENVIEEMERVKEILEKDLENDRNKSDMSTISRKLLNLSPIAIGFLLPYLIIPVLGKLSGNDEIVSHPLLGEVSKTILLASAASFCSGPMGCFMSYVLVNKDKHWDGVDRGTKAEIDYLEKDIVIQKKVLEELKKDKKNTNNTNDFYIVDIDDEKVLDKLETILNLYYNLGYSETEYLKYYQQGKLDDKLKNYTDDEGIQLANKYFEENGPKITRKRK